MKQITWLVLNLNTLETGVSITNSAYKQGTALSMCVCYMRDISTFLNYQVV